MLVKYKNERPLPQVYMSCTYCGKNISAHLRTLKSQQFSRLNVAGSSNKVTNLVVIVCFLLISNCLLVDGVSALSETPTKMYNMFDDDGHDDRRH